MSKTAKKVTKQTSVESSPVNIFFKSSFSAGGNCVEVAWTSNGAINVRDSKDPGGAILNFSRSEWKAFTDGVRNGEFDLNQW